MAVRKPGWVRVWDAPTRLTHWLLVILFAVSWWTAENRDAEIFGRYAMEWHRWSGYAMLGLLIFRVLWGLFGTSTSRFSHFVRGPREIWEHVRHLGDRAATGVYGHNALGAISVVIMLLLLVAQVVMGLYSGDIDGIESGPLASKIEFDTTRVFAKYHALGFEVLQWIVLLHVLAVVYYLVFKRDNLIGAMFTGRKRARSETVERSDEAQLAPLWRFVVAVAIAWAATWWIVKP